MLKKGAVFVQIEKSKIESAIGKWDKNPGENALPEWEALPEIELYMDQVITLLSRYLTVLGDGKVITQPMINNYVKLGIMPAPEKKRYSKVHLAYLIIICFLKQTLSMDTIKKIIPVGIETDEVKKIYSSFVENQHKAFSYVLDNVKKVAAPILGEDSEKRMTDLVIQVSIASNICKILTENIINDTGKE